MAVLACWLGLSLLVRAPRDRPTQAFAWLCLHLTVYGLTIVLPDLTDAADGAACAGADPACRDSCCCRRCSSISSWCWLPMGRHRCGSMSC